MEKKFDLYKKYTCKDDNIYNIDSDTKICPNYSIDYLNLDKRISDILYMHGIDKLSKTLFLSNSLLHYYDFETDEINDLYLKIDNYFTSIINCENDEENAFQKDALIDENNLNITRKDYINEEDEEDFTDEEEFDLKYNPLSTLNISFETYLTLSEFGIKSIDDLYAMSSNDLLKIKNLDFETKFKIHNLLIKEENSPNKEKRIISKALPIEKLGISVRTYNCLKREGIRTYGDLIKLNELKVRRIRNMGEKSAKELITLINNTFYPLEENEVDKCEIKNESINEFTPIECLNFSVRTYNCLKNEGILTYGDLIKYNELKLRKIRNLGTKSIKEIIDFLKDSAINNMVDYNANDISFINNHSLIYENGRIYLQNREKYIEDVDISNINYDTYLVTNLYKKGFKNISDLLKCDELSDIRGFGIKKSKLIKDELGNYIQNNIICLSNIDGSLKNVITRKVVSIIRDKEFDGIERRVLIDQLSNSYPYEIILECIEDLVQNRTIFVYENDKLFYRYESFPQFLYKLEPSQIKDIMFSRIDGETLNALGERYSITRERIRQMQEKFLEKNIRNGDIILRHFREDRYKYLFENYFIPKDKFVEIYNEKERTYNYLDMRYKHGSRNYKEAIDDEKVPSRQRACIQKYLDKDYIVIDGESIYLSYQNILKFYFMNHCLQKRSIDEIFDSVNNLIETNAPSLSKDRSIRVFENLLYKIPYALTSYRRKARYYNYEEYDFDKLISILDIDSYDNMIMSSKYFFEKYPKLMNEYNILDYCELHSILKNIYRTRNSKVSFTKCPKIEIGTFNSKEYVNKIVLENGSISIAEIRKIIVMETGFEEAFINQNILYNANDYRQYGGFIYDKELTLEQEEFLSSLMNDYLINKTYLINEFNKNFPDKKIYRVPNYIINKNDYTSNVEFIIKRPYTIKSYIFEVVAKKDIINISDYKTLFKLDSRYQYFEKLKWDRTFIKFDENGYINISKLNEMNVTKNDLDEYSRKCCELADHEYFNIYYLKKKGFESELDDLGFDDIFYQNIIKYTHGIQTLKFEKSYLFIETDLEVNKTKFLESIIAKYKRISSYDLLSLLRDDYGIELSLQKLKNILYNGNVYYNNIMDVFYENYQIFFEEL